MFADYLITSIWLIVLLIGITLYIFIVITVNNSVTWLQLSR